MSTTENTEEKEQDIVVQGVHNYSAAETYCRPEEPILQEKLEWFQDQKLALMMHWGLYCELGMVASWALSDKDADWSRHQVNWTDDGETFKKQYFGLNKSFNPVRFQPEEWAQMAEDCGFRYLLLTTKHHDGFCLWDTAYTDYKVTAEDCPFHENEHADIVKSMFDAFREKGIGIGAYFSKADWHCQDYWNPELPADLPMIPRIIRKCGAVSRSSRRIRFWSSARTTENSISSGSTPAGYARITARTSISAASWMKPEKFSPGFSPLTVPSEAPTRTM